MNKKQFSRVVAEQGNMTYTDAAWATDAVFEALAFALTREPVVTIQNFGAFRKTERSARNYRDLNTGDIRKAPGYVDVKLTVCPELRRQLNGENEGQ